MMLQLLVFELVLFHSQYFRFQKFDVFDRRFQDRALVRSDIANDFIIPETNETSEVTRNVHIEWNNGIHTVDERAIFMGEVLAKRNTHGSLVLGRRVPSSLILSLMLKRRRLSTVNRNHDYRGLRNATRLS